MKISFMKDYPFPFASEEQGDFCIEVEKGGVFLVGLFLFICPSFLLMNFRDILSRFNKEGTIPSYVAHEQILGLDRP